MPLNRKSIVNDLACTARGRRGHHWYWQRSLGYGCYLRRPSAWREPLGTKFCVRNGVCEDLFCFRNQCYCPCGLNISDCQDLTLPFELALFITCLRQAVSVSMNTTKLRLWCSTRLRRARGNTPERKTASVVLHVKKINKICGYVCIAWCSSKLLKMLLFLNRGVR